MKTPSLSSRFGLIFSPRLHDIWRRYGGYGLAALGAFLFSTKGIFIKLAYHETVDAIGLMLMRQIFSVPFFLIYGAVIKPHAPTSIPAKKIDIRLWIQAGLVGITGYWLASFTDFMGLKSLSPQYERLILFTYPAFVIGFGAFLFKTRIRPLAILAFVVAYLGLALIFVKDLKSYGQSVVFGTLWVLASAMSFALYVLLAKPLIEKLGTARFTAIAMVSSALVTVVHYGLSHGFSTIFQPFMVSQKLIVLSVGLAIFATVFPILLINSALSQISSQAYAIIGVLSPISTEFLSGIFLKESIGLIDYFGTSLVIAGVGLYTIFDQRSPSSG